MPQFPQFLCTTRTDFIRPVLLIPCSTSYRRHISLCTGADRCYSEGGFFKARLTFPPEFPLLPPKMRFITPMWHPNSENWFLSIYLQFVLILSCSLPWWCGLRFHTCRLLHVPLWEPAFSPSTNAQHAPGDDQYGYEDAGERWMPVHTVESIVSYYLWTLPYVHSLTPLTAY